MTPTEIIKTAADAGIRIEAQGGRLALRGDLSRLTDDLRAAIRSEAVGLAITVSGRLRSHPELYRYVRRGDRVTTPQGEGSVLQVFSGRVTVQVDGEELARFYSPEEITIPHDSHSNDGSP